MWLTGSLILSDCSCSTFSFSSSCFSSFFFFFEILGWLHVVLEERCTQTIENTFPKRFFNTLLNYLPMNLRIWACTLSIKEQGPLLENCSMSSILYSLLVTKERQSVRNCPVSWTLCLQYRFFLIKILLREQTENMVMPEIWELSVI